MVHEQTLFEVAPASAVEEMGRGSSGQTAVSAGHSAAQPALAETHRGDDIGLEPKYLALLQDEPPATSSMPVQTAAAWRLHSAALTNNMWSQREESGPVQQAGQQPDAT